MSSLSNHSSVASSDFDVKSAWSEATTSGGPESVTSDTVSTSGDTVSTLSVAPLDRDVLDQLLKEV